MKEWEKGQIKVRKRVMHKKGKVRNKKNKCCTRKPRRQTCSEERCWRWKRERRGGDAEGRDAEHRARDGASLCNRCEPKHLWYSMKTVLTGIQCKGGVFWWWTGSDRIFCSHVGCSLGVTQTSLEKFTDINFVKLWLAGCSSSSILLADKSSRTSEGQYSVTQFCHQVFCAPMRCPLPHATC
jgi:hypothetical protein